MSKLTVSIKPTAYRLKFSVKTIEIINFEEAPADGKIYGRQDESWTEIEHTPAGGGFIANVYFRTDNSDIAGYKRISYINETTPTELAITLNESDGDVLAREYLYDDPLQTTILDAGVYVANYRAKVSTASKETYLIFEAFVRHEDDTETTLFSSVSPEINNTTYTKIPPAVSHQPSFTVLETDRFGVRIYARTTRTTDVTINTIVGGEHASYFSTPIALRHDLLRNKNGNPDFQHITQAERDAIGSGGGGGGFFPEKELGLGGEYASAATDLISDYVKNGGFALAQNAEEIVIKFKHISGDGGTITSEPTIQAKVNGTLVGSAVAVSTTYQTITLSAGYTAGNTLDLAVEQATGSDPAHDSTGLIIEITAS